MAVSVKVPGSCGELVQGIINDTPFLVTCPVNRYSTVTAAYYPEGKKHPLNEKSYRAFKAICQKLELNRKSININISSELLTGKGMSSSSADIAAVCKAVSLLAGKDITDRQIAKIAAKIEPTDGIFCQGIVQFNHITGNIIQYIGTPPPLKILLFDCGGNVNTVLFNQRRELLQLNKQKEPQIKEALKLVEYGIRHNDIHALGKGATISALANQPILYKKDLPDILNIAEKYNAVGVNAAHSGTLVGILFPINEHKNNINNCIAAVQKSCPAVKYMFTAELISGGFLVE